MKPDRVRRPSSPFWGVAVLAIPAVLLIYIAVQRLKVDQQFDHSALRSQATIDRTWITQSRKGTRSYHVHYHFQDVRGLQWNVTTWLLAEDYQRLQGATFVPVVYLETSPVQSRFDWSDESPYHWRRDKSGLVFGLCFLVAAFGYYFYKRRRLS